MKYTIESTSFGCIETIELDNGKRYFRCTEKRGNKYIEQDGEFSEQMKNDGVDEESISAVYDLYDGFGAMEFIKLAELMKQHES